MMPTLTELLPLFGVWLLAVIMPGPDFLVVFQTAARRSRGAGIQVSAGVALGIFVWATVSMVGLGVLLQRFSHLYDLIRIAGGLYLAYLGISAIRSARQPFTLEQTSNEIKPKSKSPWKIGLFTNLGNPKAAVFFSSLFGGLLPAHASPQLKIGVLAVMLAIALSWFCLVSLFAGSSPVVRLYARIKKTFDYVTGALFVLLGLRLVTE